MTHLIRKLNENDYNSYLVLINEFRKTNFTKDQFIKTLESINKNSVIWVIEKDNELIATGTIIYEEKFIFNISKVGHIEDICVKEKFRMNNFGKIIVNYLIEQARINKCYKVVLECGEQNIIFYTKCGFEQRGVQMSQLCEKI